MILSFATFWGNKFKLNLNKSKHKNLESLNRVEVDSQPSPVYVKSRSMCVDNSRCLLRGDKNAVSSRHVSKINLISLLFPALVHFPAQPCEAQSSAAEGGESKGNKSALNVVIHIKKST